MIDAVIAYIRQAEPASVYGILFLTAYLENVIPPIPGDLPVAFVGYLIASSRLSFALAMFWTTLGSTAGFMTVYLLSRFLGLRLYASGAGEVRHRFARWVHKLFPPSEMEAVRQKFSAHGYLAVLSNRFLFGSRALISVVAGFLHLNIPGVFLCSLTSATLWNLLLLYGGYALGSNWRSIGATFAIYTVPVSILVLSLILYSAIRFVRARKRGE